MAETKPLDIRSCLQQLNLQVEKLLERNAFLEDKLRQYSGLEAWDGSGGCPLCGADNKTSNNTQKSTKSGKDGHSTEKNVSIAKKEESKIGCTNTEDSSRLKMREGRKRKRMYRENGNESSPENVQPKKSTNLLEEKEWTKKPIGRVLVPDTCPNDSFRQEVDTNVCVPDSMPAFRHENVQKRDLDSQLVVTPQRSQIDSVSLAIDTNAQFSQLPQITSTPVDMENSQRGGTYGRRKLVSESPLLLSDYESESESELLQTQILRSSRDKKAQKENFTSPKTSKIPSTNESRKSSKISSGKSSKEDSKMSSESSSTDRKIPKNAQENQKRSQDCNTVKNTDAKIVKKSQTQDSNTKLTKSFSDVLSEDEYSFVFDNKQYRDRVESYTSSDVNPKIPHESDENEDDDWLASVKQDKDDVKQRRQVLKEMKNTMNTSASSVSEVNSSVLSNKFFRQQNIVDMFKKPKEKIPVYMLTNTSSSCNKKSPPHKESQPVRDENKSPTFSRDSVRTPKNYDSGSDTSFNLLEMRPRRSRPPLVRQNAVDYGDEDENHNSIDIGDVVDDVTDYSVRFGAGPRHAVQRNTTTRAREETNTQRFDVEQPYLDQNEDPCSQEDDDPLPPREDPHPPVEDEDLPEESFMSSFDVVPRRRQEVNYAYHKTERKREIRMKMEAFDCAQCRLFYENLPEEDREKRMIGCSRHRAEFAPPSTPPGFWQVGFPDTEPPRTEDREIREEEKERKGARRKRPYTMRDANKDRLEMALDVSDEDMMD